MVLIYVCHLPTISVAVPNRKQCSFVAFCCLYESVLPLKLSDILDMINIVLFYHGCLLSLVTYVATSGSGILTASKKPVVKCSFLELSSSVSCYSAFSFQY